MTNLPYRRDDLVSWCLRRQHRALVDEDSVITGAIMKQFGILICLACLLLAEGCASDRDMRGPESRDALLNATGGQFDGSLPDK